MKVRDLRAVEPCSLVELYRLQEVFAAFVSSVIALMMAAASTSET
jgi:hypothetical protein